MADNTRVLLIYDSYRKDHTCIKVGQLYLYILFAVSHINITIKIIFRALYNTEWVTHNNKLINRYIMPVAKIPVCSSETLREVRNMLIFCMLSSHKLVNSNYNAFPLQHKHIHLMQQVLLNF